MEFICEDVENYPNIEKIKMGFKYGMQTAVEPLLYGHTAAISISEEKI